MEDGAGFGDKCDGVPGLLVVGGDDILSNRSTSLLFLIIHFGLITNVLCRDGPMVKVYTSVTFFSSPLGSETMRLFHLLEEVRSPIIS